MRIGLRFPRSVLLVFPWCSALWGYSIRSACYGPCFFLGIDSRKLCDQSWGACTVAKLSSYSVKSLLLSSSGRFLVSEYLTLSEPGGVSLLSRESTSVNSSFVIRWSVESAFVRVLSIPSRLLSFHPDHSDCSAGRSGGAVDYCIGSYEVGGGIVRSAVLHLSVELAEVSKCCVSVETETEAFPLPVLCFTDHSLERFCLLLHLRLNSQM